jgi:hypothetical protein
MTPKKDHEDPKIVVVRKEMAGDGKAVEQIRCASGDDVCEAIERALDSRTRGVMVRLNEELVGRLDALVEAGLCDSRSGAAAFMIREGVRANEALFEHVERTTEEIATLRSQLQELVGRADEQAPSTE